MICELFITGKTSFVVLVGYSQNIRRHYAMCRDEPVADVLENIGLKIKFSSWLSIHLLFHRLNRFYYQINSIHMRHYWILCLAPICILLRTFIHSLRIHKWIETQFWKGNFNPMFLTMSATSLSPPIALCRRMFWL